LRRPGGQYGDGVSPVIAGDLVVVQTTTLENRAAWHALEKRTGDLRWSVPVPARKPKQRVDLVDRPYSPAVPCAVGGEPHLILVGNAAIDCVARDTGARTFSHSIEDLQIAYGPFPEPVFFAPDRFFLGVWYSRQANAVVFRLGAEGMTREWSNRSIGKDTYSYVVLDSHAYGHGARGLQCVDLSSGDVRWEWRPGDRGRRKDSFEVIAVGHALVWISSSGTLYAGSASPRGPEPVAEFQAFAGFDADLRKERAQFNLSVCTSPAFAQGRIYCRSSWGELVCLDVNAGPPRQ
jgi:outer membrane protein assembly factor BamB